MSMLKFWIQSKSNPRLKKDALRMPAPMRLKRNRYKKRADKVLQEAREQEFFPLPTKGKRPNHARDKAAMELELQEKTARGLQSMKEQIQLSGSGMEGTETVPLEPNHIENHHPEVFRAATYLRKLNQPWSVVAAKIEAEYTKGLTGGLGSRMSKLAAIRFIIAEMKMMEEQEEDGKFKVNGVRYDKDGNMQPGVTFSTVGQDSESAKKVPRKKPVGRPVYYTEEE